MPRGPDQNAASRRNSDAKANAQTDQEAVVDADTHAAARANADADAGANPSNARAHPSNSGAEPSRVARALTRDFLRIHCANAAQVELRRHGGFPSSHSGSE